MNSETALVEAGAWEVAVPQAEKKEWTTAKKGVLCDDQSLLMCTKLDQVHLGNNSPLWS